MPDKIIKGNFPDFLILGPQRTGTTWLAENLRKHPEVLMSYPKEIYYLSRLNGNKKSFYTEKLIKSFELKKIKLIWKSFLQFVYVDIYRTKYYTKDDIRWYLSFFKVPSTSFYNKKNKFLNRIVRGEATATNITIDEDIIHEITKINPDLKCIIIVRHPVSRAWSHAKMSLMRNKLKNLEDITIESINNYVASKYQKKCGAYCHNIDKWNHYIKQNNLLLLSFNKLKSKPQETMQRVLKFLDVENNLAYFGSSMGKPKNITDDVLVPPEIQKTIDELFNEEVKNIQMRYGNDFI